MAFFLAILLLSCGAQHKFAATEQFSEDNSPVYILPFPEGKTYRLIQGYNSSFSHRGRLGLDFPMKTGSPVTAARKGVVVRVEEGHKKGGLNKKYYGRANTVIVRHEDGSQAYYGHLKYGGALVNPGDTVHAGDTIALSGSTGYSAFPHLHFTVWGPTPRGRGQIPTRFYTQNGIRYLKPGKRYRNVGISPSGREESLTSGN